MKDYVVVTEGWIDGNYRREGELIRMSADSAKWLLLGGQIAEAEASATKTASHTSALDHDRDGKPGGSLPASDVSHLSPSELADIAERNDIGFNTLRTAARQHLGADMPSRKDAIIAALRAL